jgi:hypothetical protein
MADELVEFPEDASAEKFTEQGPRLDRNRGHARRCHSRWVKDMNRPGDARPYPEEWYNQQFGGCRFYIHLVGELRFDWGVCSNALSPRDGKATFEHDGCDAFVEAKEAWSK